MDRQRSVLCVKQKEDTSQIMTSIACIQSCVHFMSVVYSHSGISISTLQLPLSCVFSRAISAMSYTINFAFHCLPPVTSASLFYFASFDSPVTHQLCFLPVLPTNNHLLLYQLCHQTCYPAFRTIRGIMPYSVNFVFICPAPSSLPSTFYTSVTYLHPPIVFSLSSLPLCPT